MPLEFQSVEKVLRVFKKMEEGDAINIAEGIHKCNRVVLEKARFYCPVLSGRLWLSGHAEVTGRGMGTRGSVEFGGDDAPYAVPVHERTDVYHIPPTCAKFLERAARESRGTMTALMKRQLGVSSTQLNRPVNDNPT